MKTIFALFILFGVGVLLLGIIGITLVINHIMKINHNNKFKRLIIILHWTGMIICAWLIMEGISITYNTINFMCAILP